MKTFKINFNAFFNTLLFVAVFLTGNLAWAQVTNNGIYFIQARHSGKFLDVAGGSKANNANIQQYQGHRGPAQQFRFKRNSDGTYLIQNVHSGKYFDIPYASKSNQANVQQYSYNGNANQRFYLIAAGGGYYYIRNKNSGKNLDIAWRSTSNGANCQQYSHTGGPNQQFRLISKSSSTTTTTTTASSGKRVRVIAELTCNKTTDISDNQYGVGRNTEDEVYFLMNKVLVPQTGPLRGRTLKHFVKYKMWEMGFLPRSRRSVAKTVFDTRHMPPYHMPGVIWNTSGMTNSDRMTQTLTIAEQDNKQIPGLLKVGEALGLTLVAVGSYLIGVDVSVDLNQIKNLLSSGVSQIYDSVAKDKDEVIGTVQFGIKNLRLTHKGLDKAKLIASDNRTYATYRLTGAKGVYTLKLKLVK